MHLLLTVLVWCFCNYSLTLCLWALVIRHTAWPCVWKIVHWVLV